MSLAGGNPPRGLLVAGDYNGNGEVDAADYTIWADTRGQTVTPGMGADGVGNGEIDEFDYQFWVARFGATAGSASGSQVPEPTSLWLVLVAVLAGAVGRRCWPELPSPLKSFEAPWPVLFQGG